MYQRKIHRAKSHYSALPTQHNVLLLLLFFKQQPSVTKQASGTGFINFILNDNKCQCPFYYHMTKNTTEITYFNEKLSFTKELSI